MKKVCIPIGWRFNIQRKSDGQCFEAPCAFAGVEWQAWPNAPAGVRYHIDAGALRWLNEYGSLPDTFVGPFCRVIEYDDAVYETDFD